MDLKIYLYSINFLKLALKACKRVKIIKITTTVCNSLKSYLDKVQKIPHLISKNNKTLKTSPVLMKQ